MPDSEKFAIAAHLHVLLRRKVGRVTDVEWMVKNREYALEVVRITRAEPHPELQEWADKLELAVLGSRAPQPRTPSASSTALNTLGAVLRASQPPPDHGPDSQLTAPTPLGAVAGNRYVGRLR